MFPNGKWTTVTSTRLVINQDEVLQNNAHMPRNDAAFCVWVLRQLYTTERSHMIEPFYHVGSGRPDMKTVYQRLESGQFASAAEFEGALMSVPLACLYNGKKPWNPPVHYTRGQQGKASDLLLELPERFKGRNGWERRKSQQQAPAVASTSASATAASAVTPTAAAPVHTPALAQPADSDAASVSAADAATDAHQQSRFATSLVDRTSATPKPSGRPTTSYRQGITGPPASNYGASEHPARVDPDGTSRQVSKAVDHESGLREARRGKKRASSDQGIGSSSKRPRQELEKLRYRNIRLAITAFIGSEMKLVHKQTSSMELAAGAQRYVDEMAQMDREELQDAITTDVNEFKEDHFEELVTGLVRRVSEELNNFLDIKGQSIQPRVLLSSKMKNEDVDDDSESDSNDKVKRERD